MYFITNTWKLISPSHAHLSLQYPSLFPNSSMILICYGENIFYVRFLQGTWHLEGKTTIAIEVVGHHRLRTVMYSETKIVALEYNELKLDMIQNNHDRILVGKHTR